MGGLELFGPFSLGKAPTQCRRTLGSADRKISLLLTRAIAGSVICKARLILFDVGSLNGTINLDSYVEMV
jgi:hypothetical protein